MCWPWFGAVWRTGERLNPSTSDERPRIGEAGNQPLRALKVAGGAGRPRASHAGMGEHKHGMCVPNCRLNRPSQSLATRGLSLGLVEPTRRPADLSEPQVGQ